MREPEHSTLNLYHYLNAFPYIHSYHLRKRPLQALCNPVVISLYHHLYPTATATRTPCSTQLGEIICYFLYISIDSVNGNKSQVFDVLKHWGTHRCRLSILRRGRWNYLASKCCLILRPRVKESFFKKALKSSYAILRQNCPLFGKFRPRGREVVANGHPGWARPSGIL